MVWNDATGLPVDYVARTRAYLAAARAYAPIWTARAALSEDAKLRERRAQTQRYIDFRNEQALLIFHPRRTPDGSEAAIWAENFPTRYWIAHPYTAADRDLGISPPDPRFIQDHCMGAYSQSAARREESYGQFRIQEALRTAPTFGCEPAWRRAMRAEYWDAHPLDPLIDDASVIEPVKTHIVLPHLERLRGAF